MIFVWIGFLSALLRRRFRKYCKCSLLSVGGMSSSLYVSVENAADLCSFSSSVQRSAHARALSVLHPRQPPHGSFVGVASVILR